MKIDIITLFPEMFAGVYDASIIKRAREKGAVEINLHNLRDYATDKHKTVDDTPYGGGAGMVLKVDVMDRCLADITQKSKNKNQKGQVTDLSLRKTILLTPQGKTFDQAKARELAKLDRVVLICGHYEGFDERIREHLVDEELSIGNFVLTGGEIPAMVVCDTVTRLLPGVIKEESHQNESFSEGLQPPPDEHGSSEPPFIRGRKNEGNRNGSPISGDLGAGGDPHHPEAAYGLSTPPRAGGELNDIEENLYLEYPQYTKPAEYKEWKVPEILLSGNHGEIEIWRQSKIKKKS